MPYYGATDSPNVGLTRQKRDEVLRWILERQMEASAGLGDRLGYLFGNDALTARTRAIDQQLATMSEEDKDRYVSGAIANMLPSERVSVLPPDVANYWNMVEEMATEGQVAQQRRGSQESAYEQQGAMLGQITGRPVPRMPVTVEGPGTYGGDVGARPGMPGAGGTLGVSGGTQPATGRFAGMTVNELLAWQQAHAGELFDPTDPTGNSLTPLGIEYFTALQAAQGLVGGQGGTGGGGGGGYDNSLGWAQLAEQQRQNEWARQFEMEREKQRILEAQRNLRMTGADIQSSAAARAMDLAGQLAPSAIVPGQQYIYGFEPGGIASQIAQRAGLAFTPRPAVGTQIDTGIGPRMAADLVAKAQQAGG